MKNVVIACSVVFAALMPAWANAFTIDVYARASGNVPSTEFDGKHYETPADWAAAGQAASAHARAGKDDWNPPFTESERLVQAALRELEEGGYIAPTLDGVSLWEERRNKARQEGGQDLPQPMSQFSVFGPQTGTGYDAMAVSSAASNFSSFGKPILPTRNGVVSGFKPSEVPPSQPIPEPMLSDHCSRRVTRRQWVLGAAGGLCLLLSATLLFPYDRFKPAIEAAATCFAGTPVKVNEVGVAFFPSPHLKLTGLSVGKDSEGRIAEVYGKFLNLSACLSIFFCKLSLKVF